MKTENIFINQTDPKQIVKYVEEVPDKKPDNEKKNTRHNKLNGDITE